MRKDITQYIDAAAKAAAEAVLEGQRAAYITNYYRAMESLLMNYPTLKALVEDEDRYMANIHVPPQRSKDIIVAPTKGVSARDADERLDELWRSRQAAFRETKVRFESIDRVVRMFEDRPGFVVVRMYYFGEDAEGRRRGPDEERYTWDEIALAIGKSERTARTWRTELVQNMAVCMFGTAAAIGIQTRREPREPEANAQ